MSDVLVRPTRRAAEPGNAPLDRSTTTRALRSGAGSRRPPSGQRRQRVFTARVLLIGLGLAVAWGLYLWLFIGGSIASFGNPWRYS